MWAPELTQYSRCSLTSTEWSGDDHISPSASNASEDAAQDLICLCCSSSALLTHVQLVVHQDTQVPFSKAAPQPHDLSLYWALWLFLPRCKTLHLSLLNFILFLPDHSSRLSGSVCKTAVSPFLHGHLTTQFSIIFYYNKPNNNPVQESHGGLLLLSPHATMIEFRA